MALDPNSASVISLAEARNYVRDHAENFPDAMKAFFAGSNHLKAILAQEDCIGIRIYNGYNETSNTPNLVLVGVNSQGQDITSGIIVEKLVPCPNICDKQSALYF